MVFPHQGENHIIGIKNEKDIVAFMNSNPSCNFNNLLKITFVEENAENMKWEHKGGTGTKSDAIVHLPSNEHIGISIKNHKEGTLDWVNTSKGLDENVKQLIKEFQKKYSSNENVVVNVDKKMRYELDLIFSQILDNYDNNRLSVMLDELYHKYPEFILINDLKNKRFISFNKFNLERLFNKDNNFIFKSSPRAKTSRQIWLKNVDGTEINTNLRIRIHLNNGINALFSKKGSVPCIKIQQDNVDEFIACCSDKTIDYY
jgi:hypothetical protein